MRRRDFIIGLGGAAVVLALCPITARGQQRERVRHVGVLMPFTADDQEGQARLLAFAQGLQQMGWTIGSNLRIDARNRLHLAGRPQMSTRPIRLFEWARRACTTCPKRHSDHRDQTYYATFVTSRTNTRRAGLS